MPDPNPTRRDAESGAAVRAAAARAVHAVRVRGQSLTEALAAEAARCDERDRPLLQELCFGTIRQLPRLQGLLTRLLSRPPRSADRILEDLAAVGLYQLTAMRIPAHAAVSATVAATRSLERPRAAGLINAILRRFQRERDVLLADVDRDPAARLLFPDWLLRRLRTAWPADWEQIVDASNGRPPMTLRVNGRKTDRRAYLGLLADAGITARPVPGAAMALQLDRPVPAAALPGFAAGVVSIQDASAQYAADLLAPRPGDRVLDACAAPGGKTAHLLETAGADLALTALDVDPARLAAITENLSRLGLAADVRAGDATDPAALDGPYDRILLDAPCSATGVIRRHPDIKWLRRDSDIAALAVTQQAMLEALWQTLAPGGRLLYATCSVLPEENDEQVRAFLARHPHAREVDPGGDWGIARNPGRQLLPRPDGGDGFYYALLEKTR